MFAYNLFRQKSKIVNNVNTRQEKYCYKNNKQYKQDFKAYINENIEKLKELVTDEDYSAMSELGLAPDKEDPHTLLTVYERIQIPRQKIPLFRKSAHSVFHCFLLKLHSYNFFYCQACSAKIYDTEDI